METMNRYAVYYAPRPGDFADAAAAWLGWDPDGGTPVPHPDTGLPMADMTDAPRRYGFHGTLRAPFRLAEGAGAADAEATVKELADRLAPVVCEGLTLEDLHGFLALTPQGCEAALTDLAALVVECTDGLRAPLTGDEIARRRPEQLSARQRDLLLGWGYPFVMDEFRFHLTLTRRLMLDQMAAARAAAATHFNSILKRPFVIEDLCLFGEDVTGRFHLLHRYPISG